MIELTKHNGKLIINMVSIINHAGKIALNFIISAPFFFLCINMLPNWAKTGPAQAFSYPLLGHSPSPAPGAPRAVGCRSDGHRRTRLGQAQHARSAAAPVTLIPLSLSLSPLLPSAATRERATAASTSRQEEGTTDRKSVV